MSTEIKVKFGDLGKASIYSNRRYSRECWERCAKDLLEYHRRIPIRLGSDMTERDVGYVELTSFSWPEAVFEGFVLNEGEVALKAIKDCPMAFTAKGEAVYNAQENRSIVYKMDLICLTPSAAPAFDSSVEIVSDTIDANKSDLKCASCSEPFETFEYIVEHEGKFYHENCFFDLAIEKLNAKQHHLDSSGRIPDPDDLEDAGNQPTSYTDLIREELYEIFGV